MPENGCRKIAATFNFLHEVERNMTVGRTYVSNKIRDHQLEIERIRRDQKNRVPRRVPRNLVWALDLTYLPASGDAVLGALDHGSRACLTLRKMTLKRSIDILRVVLDLVEAFGCPKILRTDNETIFTSGLFRIGLRLLGIRHQRTAPFAPWQNGRIERFFGTFKERLRTWMSGLEVEQVTQTDLDLARAWYNGVRPHQHLDSQVPAEAWLRERRRSSTGRYFSAWNGTLTGFY